MKRRAFTLIETMVTSGVVLLLVALAALAITGYLRSYQHYTEQGLRLRQAAKTLEVACFHLRSAESLTTPLPERLTQQPLRYVERGRGPCALLISEGRLVLQERDAHDQVTRSVGIGPASELEPVFSNGFLLLRLPVVGQNPPLETQIALRGIHR